MKRLVFVLFLSGCGLSVEVLGERSFDAATFDGASDAAEDSSTSDVPLVDAAPMGPGVDLTSGQYHACAIRQGVLYCWGAGKEGKLGLGDDGNRTRPAYVPMTRASLQVSAGEDHTCVRTDDDQVSCWGANDLGQLGVGDTNTRMIPTIVPGLSPSKQIAAGFRFACSIGKDGTLWCWGENQEGELAQDDGFPGTPFSNKPVQVGKDADWIDVSGGQGHGCGIRAPGNLWCWGRNANGQLAQGDGAPIQFRAPVRVGTASDWVDVDCGQGTTCAVRADGSLWCWGDNNFGQAGAAPSVAAITSPRKVSGAEYVKVETDTFHTCALTKSGALFCMGRNVEGQLGTGDTSDRSSPTSIGAGTVWAQATAGRFFQCTRGAEGFVSCTGANESGQLGTGDTDRRNVLTKVF
ncbi:MAG: RCC1 domain-containing protein [Polyangiales bacterium]